jgi:O-antigen ligase
MVGLSDHPNTLSLTGVMVSPLVMARMKTRRGLMIYGPILLVIVIGVLTSGARVGVVGLALAVGLTLALDKRVWPTIRSLGKRTLVGIGLVVAAGLVLLFVAAYSPSDSTLGKMVPSSLSRMIRPSEDTRAISDRERESRIDASLDFISERPLLGYGYNWVETSHNTVLQLILAGGVAGLAGYFLGVIGYLLIGFRLPSNVPEDRRNFCFAIAISFFVYVASGVVSNFVFGRFLYMPAGLILAVHMFQLARKEPRSETSDE